MSQNNVYTNNVEEEYMDIVSKNAWALVYQSWTCRTRRTSPRRAAPGRRRAGRGLRGVRPSQATRPAPTFRWSWKSTVASGRRFAPPPLRRPRRVFLPPPAPLRTTRRGAAGGPALTDAATAVRSYATPDQREQCAGDAAYVPSNQLQKENKTWRIFRDIGTDKLCENEPDRVEVYYFEHGTSEFLATCSGGRPTAVERVAGRGARLAGALLGELLAAPQLLLAAPVALLLHVQRCGLVALRGAATGLLQTTSDYALKPALALTFNALLQPLLVFCANVGRGVREALRPLAAALGDLLEPAARLLASARLVDVRLACPLHAAHAHHAQV